MMARFIVESHRAMTKNATRWRTGVVLSIDGCPVLVRADREQRRIDILVTSAANRRDRRAYAMSIVRLYFESVHMLNPECGARAVVPLPDQPDVAVSFDHLLGLLEKAGPDYEYFPDGADRGYTVRELLEEVHSGGDYTPRKTDDPEPAATTTPASPPTAASPGSTAIRDFVILLFATTGCIVALMVAAAKYEVSGLVFGSLVIFMILLVLMILAFVAVRSGLLPKNRFASLLEEIVKKIPVLSSLLPGSKTSDKH